MKPILLSRRVVPLLAVSLSIHLGSAQHLRAIELFSEDFAADDGGFVEEATGNTPIPSVYNAGLGTWSMEGDDAGPATNTLTSPPIAVPSTAGIRVSFDHRYSIETEWDGTALQISVDGGPFETVPGSAFSQNGYTWTGLIGNHVLNGQDGFNGDSAGYGAGEFITSVADVGGVGAGGTITLRFLGAWDEGARGLSIPGWEIDSVLVETLPDADNDGMPDEYEELNDLNDTEDDAAGDPDMDDVANVDEFLNGTDPQDHDTDDDELPDGVETNTGTFVSATDTGTDPLNSDTDGDGIEDGIESNSGTYVDEDDSGTNPLLVDTDGDSIGDASEITLGSDPNNGLDFPDGWVVRNAQSGTGLNSIANTRALFAGTNNLMETLTTHPLVNFRDNANGPFPDPVPFPLLGIQDAAADDYGLLANGQIFISEAGPYTFGFNSDDGGGLWIDGEPVVLFDANRGSQTSLGVAFLTFGNHSVEFIYWERGGGAQCQLFVHNEVGDFTGAPFDTASYQLLETSFSVPGDSEPDGLPDAWEQQYFSNLDQTATDDPDSDESDNAEELARGTDPTEPDTDGDGLIDGHEDNGGTYVSATQTGTDPLNGDSDDDGLSDGVEDNSGTYVNNMMTGTDPNNQDSDGDTFKDGFEVNLGTDPTDAGSVPDVAVVTIIPGLLGSDLTDLENDGIEGLTDLGPPQTAGTNFDWVSISASEEEYFTPAGGSEGAFDLFDNEIGGGVAKWCCGGAPVDLTVEFEEAVSLTHFTMTSSNDTPARDPLDFQIQGSNDGTNFEPIFDRADDLAIWDARNQTARIDLPSPSDAYKFIRYSVTRTGGANHALSEIEYFGTIGAPILFVITDIQLGADDMITITWNSRENKDYALFFSGDMTDFGSDINDSIPSEGETTSFTFPSPDPSAERLFFRVLEN
ncbi:MAG: discoidin domain-containing protein [Verrucomicrobiales bacterium]